MHWSMSSRTDISPSRNAFGRNGDVNSPIPEPGAVLEITSASTGRTYYVCRFSDLYQSDPPVHRWTRWNV